MISVPVKMDILRHLKETVISAHILARLAHPARTFVYPAINYKTVHWGRTNVIVLMDFMK
jgi:hypothetical protein